MALPLFSKGVRTCSQGPPLSLGATAVSTNYGMALGDGSLGKKLFFEKNWIISLPKPVNECLEKKMSVTVRVSVRRMQINLF